MYSFCPIGRFLRHRTLFAQDDSFCSIWTLFAQGVIFLPQNHQNSLGITWVWRTRPPRPAKDKNVPEIQIPTKIPKLTQNKVSRQIRGIGQSGYRLRCSCVVKRDTSEMRFSWKISKESAEILLNKRYFCVFLRAEIFHKITRFRVLRQTV